MTMVHIKSKYYPSVEIHSEYSTASGEWAGQVRRNFLNMKKKKKTTKSIEINIFL